MQFTRLKKGQLVFNAKTQEKGKVVGEDKTTYAVEVIVDQNKEEGTRTTKIVNFNKVDSRPFSPKKKRKGGALTLNGAYFEVKKFQSAMEQPNLDSPESMTKERREKRADWLKEEGYDEFIAADELVDQVDALTDALYIILGSFNEIGVTPEVPFKIVQNANLKKLDPITGKPKHNEQGKVVKPEGWEKYKPEPLLEAEIQRQIKAAEKRADRG